MGRVDSLAEGRYLLTASRRLIRLLVDKELLSEEFASNLLSWRDAGFSIDNSVRLTDREQVAR